MDGYQKNGGRLKGHSSLEIIAIVCLTIFRIFPGQNSLLQLFTIQCFNVVSSDWSLHKQCHKQYKFHSMDQITSSFLSRKILQGISAESPFEEPLNVLYL